jgi:hypothetical protein
LWIQKQDPFKNVRTESLEKIPDMAGSGSRTAEPHCFYVAPAAQRILMRARLWFRPSCKAIQKVLKEQKLTQRCGSGSKKIMQLLLRKIQSANSQKEFLDYY